MSTSFGNDTVTAKTALQLNNVDIVQNSGLDSKWTLFFKSFAKMWNIKKKLKALAGYKFV